MVVLSLLFDPVTDSNTCEHSVARPAFERNVRVRLVSSHCTGLHPVQCGCHY